MVIALVVGLGTFLVYQGKVSERRDAEARSRAMAVLSGQLDRSDPGQAALAAMAAYGIAPTQEARNAVLRGYDRFKQADWVLSGSEGKIVDTAMSVDGAVTLVTTQLGRASLFVREAGKTVVSTRLRLNEMAFRPMVSRDGRRIAYTSGAGALVWHDLDVEADSPGELLGPAHTIRDGEFMKRAEEQGYSSDPVHTADFSPDARQVATVAAGGRLRLWDLETGRHEELSPHLPVFEAVWFGSDGDTLVAQRRNADESGSTYAFVAVDTGTGRTRELATGVETFTPPAGVRSAPAVSLSGDGGVLAWCRKERDKAGINNPVYRFVRVGDGRMLNRYRSDSYGCAGVSLNESGQRFAVYGGEWVLGDSRRGGREKKAAGPEPANFTNRLLGDQAHPVVATWDETTVTGLSLRPVSGEEFNMVASYPTLIDDGRIQVAQVTRTRGRLRPHRREARALRRGDRRGDDRGEAAHGGCAHRPGSRPCAGGERGRDPGGRRGGTQQDPDPTPSVPARSRGDHHGHASCPSGRGAGAAVAPLHERERTGHAVRQPDRALERQGGPTALGPRGCA
ncbi:WD40 repeat domain-containing protein [Streptomyces sp. PG2]